MQGGCKNNFGGCKNEGVVISFLRVIPTGDPQPLADLQHDVHYELGMPIEAIFEKMFTRLHCTTSHGGLS